MKFFISQSDLLKAVSTTEKFVPSKSPLSILTGIKFFAYDNFLYLSATDLEMGIEYKIEGDSENLDIVKDGSAVIGSKILSEITRRIPGGMIEFSEKDGKVFISSGHFKMELPCYSPEDFPEVSKSDAFKSLKFNQQLFKEMIKQTIFARADETTSRPQLTGVLLDYKDNILNVVALDGFRVAWRYEEIFQNGDTEDFEVIVPGSTLLEISRIFSDDEEEEFVLKSGKNHVEFVTKNILISSRVLDGKFIDYKKVMEIDSQTNVTVSTDELLSSVERANILAKEGNKNNLIKFNITDNKIEIKTESEIGSISDVVSCSVEGQDLLIAFNARFFIDALKTIPSPEVKLDFSGSTGPCIITPVNSENHKNLILPVKLRSEDY